MSKIKFILKNQKADISISLILSFILKGSLLLIPILFGKILDSISSNNKDIGALISLILLISIFSFIASPVFTKKINKTVQAIIRCYSIYATEEIFKKKYDFFENMSIGAIIRQVERGIQSYEKLFIFIALLFIPNIISLISISIYISYISNIYIVLFLIAWSFLSVVLISYTIRLRRKHITAINDTEDELGDSFAETFLAGKTVKYLNSFKKSSKRLISKYFQYADKATTLSFYSEILKSTQTLLLNISSCIVMLIGVFLVFNGEDHLSIGDFVVIYTFSGFFMANIINLTEGYKEFDQFRMDKSRLDNIVNMPNIREYTASLNKMNLEKANITIHPFTFPINDQKKLINLEKIIIPSYSKVAIIGETGEGKTTLLKIISGIIDIPNIIYINDIDLHSMTAQEVASNIIVSFQFPAFLSGNIYRSVFLDIFTPETTNLNEKLNQLSLNNLITHNIEADINMNSLSGGEKKRLDILRNSYSHCPIVIFDEPTSSIDSTISKNIWHFIFNANKNKSLICITHDESYLDHFDIIIKIEKGELKTVYTLYESTR